MSTLYIDHKDARIRVADRRLLVEAGKRTVNSFPLGLLERIVIQQNVETSTAALSRLADAGITVHIVYGRVPRLASLNGVPGNDARRRLVQYHVSLDGSRCACLACDVLRYKLLAQYRLILKLLKARPDKRHALTKSKTQIRDIRQALEESNHPLSSLRGMEGAASAACFSALKEVLPPELEFNRRLRRPPPDPVNAVLSLAYTLAYSLALETAYTAGLDPAIGFLHEPSHGRYSLASDLMEPLRPRIDEWVWKLFRDRRLRKQHFSQDEQGCRLGKAGRGEFYTAWRIQEQRYRRLLKRLTMITVRRLEELKGE